MVKTPKTRHSRKSREPVTIELEPDAVSRIADEEAAAADDAGAASAPDAEATAEPAPDERGGFDYSFEERPSETVEDDASVEQATAAESPAAPPPAEARRGGMGGLAAGLLGGVVALLGAGALQFAGLLGAPGSGGLDGVNGQIASLQREVATLSETRTGGEADARIADLTQGLDQLRADIAALKSAAETGAEGDGAELAALAGRVGEVEGAVAALGEAQKAEPVDLGPVEQRLAGLERSVSDLTAKVEAQASQPKIALAIAASALKAALERGAPFSAELETFAAIAPDAPQLAALRVHADKGVSTREALVAAAGDAANAMITASRPVDENAGLVERLISSAESLVKVRPIGAVEGAGVPETVARMEAAVAEADYAKALAEYDSLPEAAKAAGAGFAAGVRARMEAEAGVDALVAGAMKS